MNYKLFFVMIIGSILQCLYDIFITDIISKKCAKKCHYVCDKCENCKFYYHYCKEHREKIA